MSGIIGSLIGGIFDTSNTLIKGAGIAVFSGVATITYIGYANKVTEDIVRREMKLMFEKGTRQIAAENKEIKNGIVANITNFIGIGHSDFESFCRDRGLRITIMRRVLYDEITIFLNGEPPCTVYGYGGSIWNLEKFFNKPARSELVESN
jgi:hypothetical protein